MDVLTYLDPPGCVRLSNDTIGVIVAIAVGWCGGRHLEFGSNTEVYAEGAFELETLGCLVSAS